MTEKKTWMTFAILISGFGRPIKRIVICVMRSRYFSFFWFFTTIFFRLRIHRLADLREFTNFVFCVRHFYWHCVTCVVSVAKSVTNAHTPAENTISWSNSSACCRRRCYVIYDTEMLYRKRSHFIEGKQSHIGFGPVDSTCESIQGKSTLNILLVFRVVVLSASMLVFAHHMHSMRE